LAAPFILLIFRESAAMIHPLIGITTNPVHPRNDLPYDKLAHTYCESVCAAGGIPVMLPNILSADVVVSLRDLLDGILLSGGGDIAPERFHGIESPAIGNISPERDRLEFQLVQLSVETDWPLLGICRGFQVINVALGGTLYTDIPEQFATKIQHNTSEEYGRDALAHEVTIIEGTVLAGILKQPGLLVNSFHHQAVKQIAPELKVSSIATDGLVEGLEMVDKRFFIGVQWHPECLPLQAEQRALFEAFVQTAGEVK
jgi:putative glutamine amidotransferase